MVVGIDATCNAETEQVETSETILASYRVAVCKDIANLTTTYTGLEV
jgi:hypothetical protein